MNRFLKIGLILIAAIILIFAGFSAIGIFILGDRDKHISDLENVNLRDGDIIFQTSKSSQSKAIQLATKSKYSHMGLIYEKNNELFVFEAVQPVKLTPLNDWIKKGFKGHYVVKRLKDSDKVLTSDIKLKMKKVGQRFIGKDYDLYFDWSDKRIYCSELVWKIYKEAANIEIGKLETLKDFDLSNKIVKQKLKERYGDSIPLNDTVISPISMFNSDKLITVIEK